MYLHMQAVLLCKWNTCLFRDGKVVSTCTVTWHETFLILLRSNMKHFTCRLKSFHQCVVMQYSNTIKKYIKYVRHTLLITFELYWFFFNQYTFWNEYSTFLLLYLPSCTDLFTEFAALNCGIAFCAVDTSKAALEFGQNEVSQKYCAE